ncbi:MAG: hypothetical protein O4806_16265 [Trichodesmium sp. St5_bin8]|nr:hypothetical protein [Trichodesmium sp. St5_bin8]
MPNLKQPLIFGSVEIPGLKPREDVNCFTCLYGLARDTSMFTLDEVHTYQLQSQKKVIFFCFSSLSIKETRGFQASFQ